MMKILSCGMLLLHLAIAQEVGQDVKDRIMYGQFARSGEFPHHVSYTLNGKYRCSGALITRKHVLTAAHCVRPAFHTTKKATIVVSIGSARLGRGQNCSVERISYPREYDLRYSEPLPGGDIAMIHLRVPITESASIRPIQLPSAFAEIPLGSAVVLSGHGTFQAGHILDKISYDLRELVARTVSTKYCDNIYRRSINQPIGESIICATAYYPYGACYGDSGSPLLNHDRTVLVGIVSGGMASRCGMGYPDIYTKVSYYMRFINDEIHDPPINRDNNPFITF